MNADSTNGLQPIDFYANSIWNVECLEAASLQISICQLEFGEFKCKIQNQTNDCDSFNNLFDKNWLPLEIDYSLKSWRLSWYLIYSSIDHRIGKHELQIIIISVYTIENSNKNNLCEENSFGNAVKLIKFHWKSRINTFAQFVE